VPIGTALGLGLAHISGRGWRGVRGSLLILIALPHLALAVALFYLFAFVVRANLDATAQLVAHVTIALPFVALIVWTRTLLLDGSYEEQAADLGSPPLSTVRRVLLPLCAPAIVVAAAVAFALSFNEIPLSDLLCLPNDCRTIPVVPRHIAFGRRAPDGIRHLGHRDRDVARGARDRGGCGASRAACNPEVAVRELPAAGRHAAA
jgi:ABC-type spermidine/putrescine transport system permease subunit II